MCAATEEDIYYYRINVVHRASNELRTFPNLVHKLHFYLDKLILCFNLVIQRI